MPKTGALQMAVPQAQMQRVEVEWEDSLGHAGWMTLDDAILELSQVEKMRHTTMGYVVEHTDTYIAVAQSCSKEVLSDIADRGQKVNDIMQIPMGCVKKITRMLEDS